MRDKGSLLWIDLRDRYGITQITIETEKAPQDIIDVTRTLGREYVISVTGKVAERYSKSDKIATGDIEITPDKIVVIARVKYVFNTLEECLKENDIPFSLKASERLVEPSSTFGKVFDYGMRVRLNPKDWVDGRKLCSALRIDPPKTWGSSDLLQKFAAAARKSKVQFPDLQACVLEAIQKIDLEQPNFPKLCSDLKTKIEALESESLNELDNEKEIALQELQDFRKYWTVFKLKGLGSSLSSFRNAMALGQLTEESVSLGITLSSVHTMKGLEKDIVFLMGMCEGVFPDYRSLNKPGIDEELNSAFVAVTRSRRWIYISYPSQRLMPWGSSKAQSPSQFVKKMLK